MSILRQTCKCGHDVDTHFKRKEGCLGMLCDCIKYRLYSDPDEAAAQPFRAAPAVFDPYGEDIDVDPTPSTWPLFPAAPKAWP